jgi:hypothetical protein
VLGTGKVLWAEFGLQDKSIKDVFLLLNSSQAKEFLGLIKLLSKFFLQISRHDP